MQFREQGRKIQCIRSTYDPASKRSHQKVVATLKRWADEIPSDELEKLTEAEQQELTTWFSARQAEQTNRATAREVEKGEETLNALANAIQAISSEMTDAQGAAVWQGLEKVAKALRKAKKPKPKRTST